MTDINQIELTTNLPLKEYVAQAEFMERQINDAGLAIELGGDTVARTWAAMMFREWFEGQGGDWNAHYIYATYEGDKEWAISNSWEKIDTDVRLQWWFSPDEPSQKALAMLFKLTFGGQA